MSLVSVMMLSFVIYIGYLCFLSFVLGKCEVYQLFWFFQSTNFWFELFSLLLFYFFFIGIGSYFYFFLLLNLGLIFSYFPNFFKHKLRSLIRFPFPLYVFNVIYFHLCITLVAFHKLGYIVFHFIQFPIFSNFLCDLFLDPYVI